MRYSVLWKKLEEQAVRQLDTQEIVRAQIPASSHIKKSTEIINRDICFGHEEGKIFENQNGVAVVQTSAK